MAEAAGSKFRSWQDYEADRKTPGSQVIAGMVRLGINANWVLTGEGPMMLADLQASKEAEARHDPDLDLLEGLVATVRKALMDAGMELPPEAEGRVIRLLYLAGLERSGQINPKMIAEVIRLVA